MKFLILALSLLNLSQAHADEIGVLECSAANPHLAITLVWYPFGSSTPAHGVQGQVNVFGNAVSDMVYNNYAEINRKTVGTTSIYSGPKFNLSLLNVSPTRYSTATQTNVVGHLNATAEDGSPISAAVVCTIWGEKN